MTIATMTSTQTMSGTPAKLSRPKCTNGSGIPFTIDWPFEYQSTKPRIADAVPNVMMNGSTRSKVTRNPLMPPTNAPRATPNRMPTHMFQPWWAYIEAVITCARPAMLPTDRSKLPATIVTRMPSVSTPMTACPPTITRRLSPVRNTADVLPHVLYSTNDATSRKTSEYCFSTRVANGSAENPAGAAPPDSEVGTTSGSSLSTLTTTISSFGGSVAVLGTGRSLAGGDDGVREDGRVTAFLPHW